MAQKLQEHELVALLQAGERRALEYLYDNYSAALLGILTKITRDRHTAQDLLQETFTKVWLNRASYDTTKGALFTWMVTIARRLGIDKIRTVEYRASASNRSLEDFADTDMLGAELPFNPETSDIRRFVAALAPEQRQIIDLMYFQGYSQSEIAEEFNIPLGTVKSRARFALMALRKHFT